MTARTETAEIHIPLEVRIENLNNLVNEFTFGKRQTGWMVDRGLKPERDRNDMPYKPFADAFEQEFVPIGIERGLEPYEATIIARSAVLRIDNGRSLEHIPARVVLQHVRDTAKNSRTNKKSAVDGSKQNGREEMEGSHLDPEAELALKIRLATGIENDSYKILTDRKKEEYAQLSKRIASDIKVRGMLVPEYAIAAWFLELYQVGEKLGELFFNYQDDSGRGPISFFGVRPLDVIDDTAQSIIDRQSSDRSLIAVSEWFVRETGAEAERLSRAAA